MLHATYNLRIKMNWIKLILSVNLNNNIIIIISTSIIIIILPGPVNECIGAPIKRPNFTLVL